MDISVREATATDYEILDEMNYGTRLYHHRGDKGLFTEPDHPVLSREEYTGKITGENTVILLAEADGEPAGFLHAIIEELPPETAMVRPRYLKIRDLYVAEKVRRRGVGETLMQKAYEWGKARGVTHAVLFVWSFNESAIRFYEKMGYRTDSMIMAKNI